LHLQWSLAVDRQLRERWEEALDDRGEVSCEALGGVHLLWQGIFAFKVHTPPARTDLVLNKAIDALEERAVEGFVLTEWKRALKRMPLRCSLKQTFNFVSTREDR
jgi:hypothetical protein